MDIEKERIKINCNFCNKDIILTFNTIQCPNCGSQFSSEEVHQVFYNYESRVANSKLHQFSEKMQKSGENMEKTGNTISQLGCFIFLLPLGLLCLWFLITMFK
ncbi:hypothetical protein [Enterococcus mundtii]|uniref:hypothetical protein n=1 Tax=Enterococcus mundtii TaxID=53346 RepID=UPI001158DA4A|nr:hypothetical protein [Enterococcus mundtii]